MTFPLNVLEAAHQHCAAHRSELEASEACGCFYCAATYPPSEIEQWIQETSGNLAARPDPQTAVCPRCQIDAVIGSASGFPVTDPTFLSVMHAHWFERVVHVED